MTKKVLITGILGQDGSYLAKHALEQGYEVIGGARGPFTQSRLRRLGLLGVLEKIKLVGFDLESAHQIETTINQYKPDIIFNMAAQSSIAESFVDPVETAEIGGMGALRIFEVARHAEWKPRVFQASSSEIFGDITDSTHSEDSLFNPKTPYGATKLFAHIMAETYRTSYGTFVSTGILFNHESPLRGDNFVTRKIIKGLVGIRMGKQSVLRLGNLNACRDWSHVQDFVEAIWKIMHLPNPDNFVLASGNLISVRSFVELTAGTLDMKIKWEGSGLDEKGYDVATGKAVVTVDPKFYRPYDPVQPKADTSKARTQLDWEPKISLSTLIESMVDFEINQIAF